jgi:hypothetical protein
VNMAKKRPNVIPIIEDARHPAKYRMLVPMVDVIFADVAQPDQVHTAISSPPSKICPAHPFVICNSGDGGFPCDGTDYGLGTWAPCHVY